MHEAAAAGARLAQFSEGAITCPGKYVISSAGAGRWPEADWSRIDSDVLREEAGESPRWPASPASGRCSGRCTRSPRPAAPQLPVHRHPRGGCSPATTSGPCWTPWSPGCTPPAPGRSPACRAVIDCP
jgi:hypothetical protein